MSPTVRPDRRPRRSSSGVGMLTALIIALLVVLAVMAVAIFVVLTHFVL